MAFYGSSHKHGERDLLVRGAAFIGPTSPQLQYLKVALCTSEELDGSLHIGDLRHSHPLLYQVRIDQRARWRWYLIARSRSRCGGSSVARIDVALQLQSSRYLIVPAGFLEKFDDVRPALCRIESMYLMVERDTAAAFLDRGSGWC